MPAAGVPVAAILGRVARHDDLVSFALADLVVAAGAAIFLFGLVRLHVPHLDVVARFRPAVRSHTPTTVTVMEGLLVHRADGIVTLTIDRPQRKNAITGDMWRGLVDIFDEVADNRDDRVLVVTGSGDAFCSGADLTERGRG